MNYAEAPRDDARVRQIFESNEKVGADSSIWLRATRQLTQNGKTLGELHVFTIPIESEKNMPIGIMTFTKKNRLVFWPVLPRRDCKIVNRTDVLLPDHITVEFPSEKIHATSYHPKHGRAVYRDAWRSVSITSEIRLLFYYLVRRAVLEDQDVLISRKFIVPPNDVSRRTDEFGRFGNNFQTHVLPLQGEVKYGDFACFALYRITKQLTRDMIPSSLLPIPHGDEIVDGWPKNAEFPLTLAQFTLGELNFGIASGYAPGRLKDDLVFSFPRRGPSEPIT